MKQFKFKAHIAVLAILALVSLALLQGCGVGTNKQVADTWTTQTPTQSFYVREGTDSADCTYYRSDGTPLTRDEFQGLVQSMMNNGEAIGEIKVTDKDSPAPGEGTRLTIGCYRIMFRGETHYMGSCIRRNTFHIQFQIRNICNQRDVFNAGVANWWQNGPQIGIFEERSGFCAQSRGKWTAIRDNFLRSLAVVGITGSLAYLIANAMASTTVAVFAL